MLKTSYEELKMWVDPSDGTLNVQIDDRHVKVPHDDGRELIGIMVTKQRAFQERERTKKPLWDRCRDFFNFEPELI